MWAIINFYRKCANAAWSGSWGQANTFGAVFGGIALAAALYLWGPKVNAPASIQGAVAFACGTTVASIVCLWALIYLARFFDAPRRLYFELEKVIPVPARSDIAIHLHSGLAWIADRDLKSEIAGHMAFVAGISNVGDKLLRDCQIHFDDARVSGRFELRIGEEKEFPVLHLSGANQITRAIIYFIDDRTGEVSPGAAGWLPAPGIHHITVLSADTAPATLDVELTRQGGSWDLGPVTTENGQYHEQKS